MTVLITNVEQFAGPGTLPVLLREARQVYCHDASFAEAECMRQFQARFPATVALRAQTPDAIADELAAIGARIDTVIHNDVHPNSPAPIEATPLDMYRQAFEALVLFPLALTQQLLPSMKEARRGCFVFVTSARYLQPEPGFSVATSVRSAATQLAMALARELASLEIPVNVVAPNYLYSEAYYPRARYLDDPAGRAEIAAKVPLGRLGRPEEIGELIAFLASGRAPFMTGQIVDFTGGWP